MKRLTFHAGDMKLRTKLLWAFGFVILITVLMSSVVNYYVSVSVIKRNTSDYSAYLTEQIGINLEKRTKDLEQLAFEQFRRSDLRLLFSGENASLAVADNYMTNRVILNYLNELLYAQDDISTTVFIDRGKGTYSLQRNDNFYPVDDIMNGIDIEQTLNSRGRAVWFPGNGSAVLMAKALYDISTSAYMGTVVMAVDSSQIHDIYTKVNELTQGRIIIFNDIGQPFLRKDVHDELISYFLKDGSKEMTTGNHFNFELKGDSYLYTLTESPSKGWNIVQVVPVKEVTRGTEIIKTWTLQSALIALAIGFLLAAWISNSITGNVRLLLKSMTQFAYDIKHRLPTSRNKDEIGVMGDRFNAMAAKIEELLDTVIEQKLLKQRAEYRTLQFEYKALQSQMNPHFLYNTLEAIHSLAKLKGDDEISELVYLLGSLLRESISKKGDLISLSEELAFVRKYLAIHQVIYGDKIEVCYETDSSLDDIPVPKFILQPLVENAVIHGIESKPGKGYIRISSYTLEEGAILEVEDNGIGMDEDQIRLALHPELERNTSASDKHTRVGLVSVGKRLQILYGDKHSLSIKSVQSEGTTIRIMLPIQHGEGNGS
ncbi:Sensor histidine kinase YpdA [compost metagenome]